MSTVTVKPTADTVIPSGTSSTGTSGSFWTTLVDGNSSTCVSMSPPTSPATIWFMMGTTLPLDFGTATAVLISLDLIDIYFPKNTPDCVWSSVRIYKTDRTTPLTSSSVITATNTLVTYTYTPNLSGPASKSDWQNCVLALTTTGMPSTTSPTIYEASATITYTATVAANRLLNLRRRKDLSI